MKINSIEIEFVEDGRSLENHLNEALTEIGHMDWSLWEYEKGTETPVGPRVDRCPSRVRLINLES